MVIAGQQFFCSNAFAWGVGGGLVCGDPVSSRLAVACFAGGNGGQHTGRLDKLWRWAIFQTAGIVSIFGTGAAIRCLFSDIVVDPADWGSFMCHGGMVKNILDIVNFLDGDRKICAICSGRHGGLGGIIR